MAEDIRWNYHDPLNVGDTVTYRCVSLAFSYRGTVSEINGTNVRVKWTRPVLGAAPVTVTEYGPNLCRVIETRG